MGKINKIKRIISLTALSAFFLTTGLYLNNCRTASHNYGSLEGKITLKENLNSLNYNRLSSKSTKPQDVKICLRKKNEEKCESVDYTDSYGNYQFSDIPPGKYEIWFDISDDGFPDGFDKTSIKGGKITYEEEKEIESKEKKDFNCYIALDKQNYCVNETMYITLHCKNNEPTPYNLKIQFVNEKDKEIYGEIDVAGPIENKELSYQIPETWPLTNSQPGADWKAYLYSLSEKYGNYYEDKDNFNLLDICNTNPGELKLEIVIENGREFTKSKEVNVTYAPSDLPDLLARCITDNTCEPSNYENFRQNEIVTLTGDSGEKKVFGKVKKGTIESNIANDSIILDLLPPSVYLNASQNNLDNGNKANDINVEICFSDNYGIDNAEVRFYDPNGSLLEKKILELIPNQSCAQPGEIGYKTNINFYNVEKDGVYIVEVEAIDYAGNYTRNEYPLYIDLTPPNVNFEVLDHLLRSYVIYPPESSTPTIDAETRKNLDGSEFRYADKYTQGQQSCDSLNCYDGKLDIKVEANDNSEFEIFVDWGEGNVEEFNGSSTLILSHPYATQDIMQTGDYLVKVSGCDIFNNCSSILQKKVKIVMTQKDADDAFWGIVKDAVPGLAPLEMYGYDCSSAIAHGKNIYCIVTDDSFRRTNIYPGVTFVNDFYQAAQDVGHVYVTPEKHDFVGNDNYNNYSYCETNLPPETGLANCEIPLTLNIWFRARGPPHPIAIIPTDYRTFTTTDCTLPDYDQLYCAYKLEDDRGDF
ncbi:MAG: hypothetical protein QW244_02290 [Candidatus Pacearchaeota archaeon]